VAISALDDRTLPPLIARLEERVEKLWGKRDQQGEPDEEWESEAPVRL
jgi:hypothetical protein